MASLARSARTVLAESRASISPPTFLFPLRARMTTAATTTPTTSHSLDTSGSPAQQLLNKSGQQTPSDQLLRAKTPPHSPPKPASSHSQPAPHALTCTVSKIDPQITRLLPLLHSQPAHYATIHIHGRPFLITKGDTIRLPFLMPSVQPGDTLRLNRATHIGSRDYTLKAPAVIKGSADHGKKVFYLDERIFTCRARVMGVESEPMRVEEKTKRRRRHVKHVRSKMRFTVLRVSELEVKSLDEYRDAVGAQ